VNSKNISNAHSVYWCAYKNVFNCRVKLLDHADNLPKISIHTDGLRLHWKYTSAHWTVLAWQKWN